MRRFLGLALVGSCLAVPAAVRAQTCGGIASFAAGPLRIGGGVGIADGGKTYNANLNAGSVLGPFAGASVGRVDADGVDNNATVVSLSGGYSIDINPEKTVQFCPIASFDFQSGPDVGPADVSAHALSFGGSFGVLVPMSPTLMFVPFASASYVTTSARARVANVSVSTSDDYALLTFGAGFVMNRTVTIQPAVAKPVGLPNAGATFTLAIALNFGSSGTTTSRSETTRR